MGIFNLLQLLTILLIREIFNKIPTLIDSSTTYALIEYPTPRIR